MKKVLTHKQLIARAIRRPPNYKPAKIQIPPAKAYLAEGGPYNGQVLALQDGSTCFFRSGQYQGRYLLGLVSREVASISLAERIERTPADLRLRHSAVGTTVWQHS